MFRLSTALFVLFLFPSVASAQTDPQAAARFISELGDKAVEVLQDQSTTLESREERLRGIVAESMDISTIGEFAVGKSWDRASQDEKEEYMELFSVYLLQIYTQRLGDIPVKLSRLTPAVPIRIATPWLKRQSCRKGPTILM